jgi:hypothetical protein
MAERSGRLPLTFPTIGLPSRSEALRLALDWYGLPVVCLLGLVSALLFVESPVLVRPAFDDSYISATFARNLAEHAKLSFDGQTWSTGATSPLHVGILAVLIKLGADPIIAGVYFGVVCQVLLCGATYLLAWAVFRNKLAAFLAGLTIAFTAYAAVDAGNGLETSLFMVLIAVTMASYLLWSGTRARALTGALITLAILTRPEGMFLIPAVIIYRWLERSSDEPLRSYFIEVALLAAPGLAALVAEQLYSLAVSGAVGGTASAKLKFFQEYRQPLQWKVDVAFDLIGRFAAPLMTLIALAALVVRRKESVLFVLFVTPIFAMYVLLFPGGLEHYFFRYQHPVLPLLAVLAGGGAAYLLNLAAANGFVVKALIVGALVVVVVPVWQQYEKWRATYETTATETRTNLESMAKDLNTIVRPGQVLATHDIGAVGYYADYQVLDLVGLVNEKVLPYHRQREVKQYIEGAHPDYLLIFPEWDPIFLRIFPGSYPEKYQLVKVYPGGSVRISPYILYRIVD